MRFPASRTHSPDLDATVRVVLNNTKTNESVACVEADVSNGKTVNLLAVKWDTCHHRWHRPLLILPSLNGLGHANAAAHIASGALSLFGFFQAQAILGMTSVRLPPVVQSWTQDFQWSMGIINVDFLQDIFTWYPARHWWHSFHYLRFTNYRLGSSREARFVGLARCSSCIYRRSASLVPMVLPS